jgi:hypothetical protein
MPVTDKQFGNLYGRICLLPHFVENGYGGEYEQSQEVAIRYWGVYTVFSTGAISDPDGEGFPKFYNYTSHQVNTTHIDLGRNVYPFFYVQNDRSAVRDRVNKEIVLGNMSQFVGD